jgi:hypothetical protein
MFLESYVHLVPYPGVRVTTATLAESAHLQRTRDH